MGCAYTEKESHTLRSDSSADPQCQLGWQPQRATNTLGGRVRVPSHGTVCVTVAKHKREEHGYSWVTSLTNGVSAYPCVPHWWEKGRRGKGPLHSPWTPGPALGHSVLAKLLIPHHPGTVTVPLAETCHCPGRGCGMLLLLVCCPPQPIH